MIIMIDFKNFSTLFKVSFLTLSFLVPVFRICMYLETNSRSFLTKHFSETPNQIENKKIASLRSRTPVQMTPFNNVGQFGVGKFFV